MLNFTVDSRIESIYYWYLHGVGFVVLPLNLCTFYLIYAKTPKHCRRYRAYVLHMQFWTTFLDAHVGVLFMPMLLFPLFGGYCSGLLCRAGLPMHYSMALFYCIVCGIYLSLGMSIFYRHQLILTEGHWLKVGNSGRLLLLIVASSAIQSPAITLMLAKGSQIDAKHFLKVHHPAMMWLTEKQNWVAYDAFSFPILWVNAEAAVLVLVFPTAYFLVSAHLYRGIVNANLMSEKTRRLHKHIVKVLITQVCLVSIFLIAPVPVFIFSMVNETISHEVNLLLFVLILLYSWSHSLVLIASTPSYRSVISSQCQLSRQLAVQPI